MKKRKFYVPFSMIVIGLCHVMSLAQAKCSPICKCTRDMVHCYYTTLFRIPRGLPTSTKIIRFHNNRMLRLTAGQLQTFSHLRELFLPYNGMTAIDRHALQGLHSLKILNISHNAIQTIHNGLLYDLSELRTLDVSYNMIQNMRSGAFEKIQKLRILSLESNKLSHIPSDLFNISTLEVLRLGKNPLKTLQPDIFTRLPNLLHLMLDEINLTKIPEELFTNLTKLKVLSLFGNQLVRLHLTMFDDMESLLRLILAENSLVCDCRLLELRTWMTVAMDIDWTTPSIPQCNLQKIGHIYLTNLVSEHFVDCKLKQFVMKRRHKPPPEDIEMSEHKSKYTLPYDPMMGIYTAVCLSSMLIGFFLCLAYYKVKKRIKRRFREWKMEQNIKKGLPPDGLQYMQTSISDNSIISDRYRGHSRIETLSDGSDSIADDYEQEYFRSRQYHSRPRIVIQETVV
ncbi:slit homolog 3 protein-like [Lineus longissimus]|uniref:slit homolog 3 protein-like n=1 Tax=Lineus longissimus TaxID=88925 RepID=UPI00315D0A0D